VYATSFRILDNENNVLMVSTLANPMKLDNQTDFTVTINYNT